MDYSSPTSTKSDRPSIKAFELERYRAFGGSVTVELGRITLILGRNNAGKSALCFAPVHFVQAFRPDSPAPLPSMVDGLSLGPLSAAIFRRQPSGLRFRLHLEDAGRLKEVALGVTVAAEAEARLAQLVTTLEFVPGGPEDFRLGTPWDTLQRRFGKEPALARLPDEVLALKGIRPELPNMIEPLGYEPLSVDATGELAAQILWSRGKEGLASVNEWYEKLNATLATERRGDFFEITARGGSAEPVNLLNSGTGLIQALPLVVQTRLARRMPRLWCIEQPELHLHPRAHVAVAELLLDCLCRYPSTRLLVETHSDIFVLRIRREVAAGRLAARDVRIYFVEEGEGSGGVGSTVREIELTDEGTPRWWPTGVFAEPQREYYAIRRALRARG